MTSNVELQHGNQFHIAKESPHISIQEQMNNSSPVQQQKSKDYAFWAQIRYTKDHQ